MGEMAIDTTTAVAVFFIGMAILAIMLFYFVGISNPGIERFFGVIR